MKSKALSNQDGVRQCVVGRQPFHVGNIYAKLIPSEHGGELDRYVVFSYGGHFPLYVYEGGVWYENEDWGSATTSRHRSKARPSAETVVMPSKRMRQLVAHGIAGVAAGVEL